MSEYARSENGLIHLVNPAQGEFTLCGDAFDINSEAGDEEHAWVPWVRSSITCENCARVILACRGVRIAKGVEP